MIRTRHIGCLHGNSILQAERGSCTYEFNDCYNILKTCTYSNQKKNPSTKKGKCTQIPPWSNRLLASILWKMKVSFFQWSVNEYINHNLGQVPCLGVVAPNKMHSVFCLYGLFFPHFCSIFIFSHQFFVSLFCRVMQSGEGEEGREIEGGRENGEGS